MSKKLTPWFPSSMKPARKGVYIASVNRSRFYRYWDGKNWYHGSYYLRFATEAVGDGKWDHTRNPLMWRGLAKEPK